MLQAVRILQPQAPADEQNVQALLQDVIKHQRSQAKQFTEYTADRTATCRDLNWNGAMVEEITVSEHFQSWNRNLDVILSVNGKPRSEKEIQRDREEAARFMEIDMRGKSDSLDAEGPEYGSRRGNLFMSVFLIYRNAAFTNSRMEVLDGRPVIALDFSPRPQPDRPAFPVDHLCGTVWIDAADHVTAKLVARMAPLDMERQEEPVFVQAYTRMPEGIWLGSYTRLNPSVKPEFFNGETYDWIIESRNYRRFLTGEIVLREEEPKKRR